MNQGLKIVTIILIIVFVICFDSVISFGQDFACDILLSPSDESTQTQILTFAGHSTSTDGYDSNDVISPPPGLTYYAFFNLGTFPNYLQSDSRAWSAPYQVAKTWTLAITNASSVTTTLSWNSEEIPSIPGGKFTLLGASESSVDMVEYQSASVIGNAELMIDYVWTIPDEWILTMTIDPGHAGNVVVDPKQNTYIEGTVVKLVAEEAAGYHFDCWEGDVSDVYKDTTTVIMNSDKLIKAHYTAIGSSVDVNRRFRPNEFQILQNYPNPFNPTTVIQFQLPKRRHTEIKIYNLNGLKIATLVDDHLSAGQHQVIWDSKNNNGEFVSSGMYIISMEAGEYRKCIKTLLMK